MKILDRYILNSVVSATLMVSVVVIAIQFFLDVVQQFHSLGQHDYDLWHAFLYVFMQMPAQFYQLFPMAGFLGALIGLGRLAASSQLIVMRAAGVSVIRIAGSVLKAALIMVVIATMIGEGIGLSLQQKSDDLQKLWLAPTASHALLHDIWLRHDHSFTHIGALNSPDTMTDITHYTFSPNGRLIQASYASTGRLVNGQWRLSDLKESIFTRQHLVTKELRDTVLPIDFKPILQVQMQLASTEQTLNNLWRVIHYRHTIGLGVSQFVFALSQRILQPITTLVMILLAVPFVFGSFRSTTMGVRILMGVFIGFIFYMLNQLFGPITLVYQVPPILAAMLPTMLFLGLASVLLARVR